MKKLSQVLIVDDDSTTNLINEKLVRDAGLTSKIKVAVNGGHAMLYLQQLSENQNEEMEVLILLDLDMPIMDGYEFLKYIQASKEFRSKNLKVAVMAMASKEEEIVRAKSLGAHGVISKPLSLNKLNKVVQKL